MAISTDIAAFSAVVSVVLKVDTGSSTRCCASHAVGFAFTLGTDFVVFTGFVAFSAVLGVGFHINASASTFGLISGALEGAFTIGADFVGTDIALLSTDTTVFGIRLRLNTLVETQKFSVFTVGNTLCIFADFICFTFGATLSTVILR